MIYYNMKYIIYKIQIKDYIYIGSTQNFTVRKNKHKKNCNNEKEQRHNCLVYKNNSREWWMGLLHNGSCKRNRG
jgi:predicted GIY-YIG superfamily endonuclease